MHKARWILWNFISSKNIAKKLISRTLRTCERCDINIFFSKKEFYCNCMSVAIDLMKRIERRIVRATIIQDNNSALTRKILKMYLEERKLLRITEYYRRINPYPEYATKIRTRELIFNKLVKLGISSCTSVIDLWIFLRSQTRI